MKLPEQTYMLNLAIFKSCSPDGSYWLPNTTELDISSLLWLQISNLCPRYLSAHLPTLSHLLDPS